MKKQFTLVQRAVGICIVVSIIMASCLVLVSSQMGRLLELETAATTKIVDENEASRLIAQANHHTTKMASSFKNVLLRGEGEGAADKYKKEFNKFVQQFEQTTTELLAVSAVAVDQERVQAIKAWQSEFSEASNKYAKVLDGYDPKTPFQYRELDKAVSGIDRAVVKHGLSIEELGLKSQSIIITQSSEKIRAETKLLLQTLYGSMALALLVLCACLMLYARSVRNSLGAEPVFLGEQASKIAAGDLQCGEMATLVCPSGSVVAAFEKMRMALLELVRDIGIKTRDAERNLDSIRQQLGAVDKAAISQSNSSANMASGIEEMSANIAQLFDVAEQTKLAAEGSSTESLAGLTLVESTSEDVEKTAQGAAQLSRTVHELGAQSNQINQIVSVIEEIAGQTNLLALNAAIEAARAGEQGRGFAVVADEVRRLAERTKQSTSEIEQMVSAIQKGTQNVVTEMTGWANKVSASLGRMHQTKDLMGNLKQRAGDVRDMASEVTSSLSEQRSAANQLSTLVETYTAMSEDNAGCVGEIRKSLHNLTEDFTELNVQCKKFKIS